MSNEQLENYFRSKKEEDDFDKLLNHVKYSEKLSHVHSLDSFLEGIEKKFELGKYCAKNDSNFDLHNQMPPRQETVKRIKKRNNAFRAAAKILRDMQQNSKNYSSYVKNATTVESNRAEDFSGAVQKSFDEHIDTLPVNGNSEHKTTPLVNKPNTLSFLTEETNGSGGLNWNKVAASKIFKENNHLIIPLPLTRSKVIEIEREVQQGNSINNGAENLQADKCHQRNKIHNNVISEKYISSGSHSPLSIVTAVLATSNGVLKSAGNKTTGQNTSDRIPKWVQPSTTTTSNKNTNGITHQTKFQSQPDRSSNNNETVATIRNRPSGIRNCHESSSNSETSMRTFHNEDQNNPSVKNSNTKNNQVLRFFGVPFKTTKESSKSSNAIFYNAPKPQWR